MFPISNTIFFLFSNWTVNSNLLSYSLFNIFYCRTFCQGINSLLVSLSIRSMIFTFFFIIEPFVIRCLSVFLYSISFVILQLLLQNLLILCYGTNNWDTILLASWIIFLFLVINLMMVMLIHVWSVLKLNIINCHFQLAYLNLKLFLISFMWMFGVRTSIYLMMGSNSLLL